MAHTLARAQPQGGYRRKAASESAAAAADSVGASPAAPLGGIRQQKQVQAGEKEEGERGHRQEAHPSAVLLLCHRNDVDDDGHRKGHG